MSCDCIKRIEGMLNQKMIEAHPGCEVEKSVSFENRIIRFGSGDVVLGNPVVGKVKKGKRTLKFTSQVAPHFCSFCGKSLDEGGEK